MKQAGSSASRVAGGTKSLQALLQKSCTTCTKSSIRTYYYNIKALAKIAGYDEPPKHGRWIDKTLLAKIR